MAATLPEPKPKRDSRVWLYAAICVVVLVCSLLFTLLIGPEIRAHAALNRLESHGAGIRFLESDDPISQLWMWATGKDLATNVYGISMNRDDTLAISDDDLAAVRAFPRLSDLDVDSHDITSEGLRHLRGLGLESLFLGGTQIGSRRTGSDPKTNGLEVIASLRKLRTLDLSKTRISDSDLSALTHLPELECLILSRTRISTNGLSHLNAINTLTNLDLRETDMDDASFQKLSHMKRLWFLNLSGTQVTGKGLDRLSGTALSHLKLNESAFGDDGMACLTALPRLKHLSIDNTRVTRRSVSALKGMPALISLSMEGLEISDQDLAVIAECRNLESLGLFETPVTAAGLVPLQRLVKLEHLKIEGDLLQKQESVDLLNQLPKLRYLNIRIDPEYQLDEPALRKRLNESIALTVDRRPREAKKPAEPPPRGMPLRGFQSIQQGPQNGRATLG